MKCKNNQQAHYKQVAAYFQLLESHSGIAHIVPPVKSYIAFYHLESRTQVAVIVSWQSVNTDSGLLIVAPVTELIPNRLGQVLLVDLAALHCLITAHAVTDTGRAGCLGFETSGRC